MKLRTRWIACLSAVAVLMMATATAFGYSGEVAATVTIAAQGTITCDVPFTVTATIVDVNGSPVSGQSVAWSWVATQSASDKINETPTTTNANGVATTTVALAPVTGNREIRATSGDVSASAVLGQSCGGLPNTSTLPAETPRQGAPIAVMLVVALALALGGGLTLRRVAATSR
jgi:hypothetical protein